MENMYSDYIREVINHPSELDENHSLLHLDELLDGVETKEIVNEQEYKVEIYSFLRKELSFIQKYKNNNFRKIEKEDILKGSDSLEVAKHFIARGIINKKVQDIIKGTLIVGYFEIPFEQVLKLEEFREQDRQAMSENLEELLSGFSVQMNINPAAYSDTQYYEEYKIGVVERNVYKVYSFVQALDGEMGYSLDGVIRGLIKFTFFINRESLKNSIHKKSDPFEIIAMMEPLEDEEKLELGLGDKIENAWVLIGIIYQVLGYNRAKNHKERVLDKLTTVLEQLESIDNELFFQSIKFFAHYKTFNIILGGVLGKSKEESIDRYVKSYRISEHRSPENHDEFFIKNFYENAGEEKTLLLCSQMFKKWAKYLEEVVKQEKYVGDLIRTNCIYFITYYYILRKNSSENFLAELEEVLSTIEGVNYIWCNSSLEIRAKFFKNLTYLWLLSIEGKEKLYAPSINKELNLKLELLLDDKRLWTEYFKTVEKPSLLDAIQMNLAI